MTEKKNEIKSLQFLTNGLFLKGWSALLNNL
jgi:hypothetical protein